jgi:acyl-ACP thioesterase
VAGPCHNAGVSGTGKEDCARGFLPDPVNGRVYVTARRVRSTDVTPSGRLRFDALARYLQEAAEDDVGDAGLEERYGWLLRRCAVAVRRYPRYGEELRLRTFCSATGARWAERTTTVAGPGGDIVQARAIWVAVELATGQPCPLGPQFHRLYGPATGGRPVSARLSHPAPDGAGPSRDWPLRASDFDPAGHVNNSVHWAAAEDVLAGLDWLPAAAEIEYHRPILPGAPARLITRDDGGQVLAWLLAGRQRLASVVLAR